MDKRSKDPTTIMIIEDDPDIVYNLCEFFNPDYKVLTAQNGLEALGILRGMDGLPCIIFLDLMMPVMNGWDFIEIVEKEGLLPGVQVVIISAAGAGNLPPKAITFLRKPFDIHDLEAYTRASCSLRATEESTK